MTITEAKSTLRLVGITLNKTAFDEFRVNLLNGTEETAYYTGDLEDAFQTGVAMASLLADRKK